VKTKRALWIAFDIGNWLLIAFFWYANSGSLLTQGSGSILVALGRLFGLMAGYLVLTQFFLMGRNPLLEQVFGLDRLARIHQLSGKLAYIFILLHPLTLLAGYKLLSGVGWGSQFVSLLTDFEDTIAAFIAVIFFTLVVVTALTMIRRKLRYEWWYCIHLLVYIAVFLSFGHQIDEGTDLLASDFFYYYWLALYTIVLGSHLIFRFLRPLYNLARHHFTVSRVVRESASVVSIYITGRNLKAFTVRPGQFMFFRFLHSDFWYQSHPFSLSKLPDGTTLRITVKAVGDYTTELPQLPTGTRVLIDGPYGLFTRNVLVQEKVLMIAGGIGITPIRSLSEELVQAGKDVVLVYGNRTSSDIVFKQELEQIKGLSVIHVLSEEQQAGTEYGRIDAEKLQRLVPDIAQREVYLCGPVPMMDALIKTLVTLGVPTHAIHHEKFAL
jgi:predicted ferric reductase